MRFGSYFQLLATRVQPLDSRVYCVDSLDQVAKPLRDLLERLVGVCRLGAGFIFERFDIVRAPLGSLLELCHPVVDLLDFVGCFLGQGNGCSCESAGAVGVGIARSRRVVSRWPDHEQVELAEVG